jgi:NhaA family Na+:H+ antiporter
VNFLIVPLFALANAGVDLRGGATSALGNSITWGVLLGLFVGKPMGVLLASWVAVKCGMASLPEGATVRQVIGVSVLCGIGFTMSLFVAHLAFPGAQAQLDACKVGILAGSVLSGAIGASILVSKGRTSRLNDAGPR